MKEVISFERHIELGELCKLLHQRLMDKSLIVRNSVGNKRKGEKKAVHYIKAIKALSKFRHHMEEIMFKEHNEKASTGVYYGRRLEELIEEGRI